MMHLVMHLQAPTGASAAAPLMYLVGNKSDLGHLRRVTQESHDAFIASRRMAGGFLVSARTGDGVMLAMYTAAAAVAGVALSAVDRAEAERVVAVVVRHGGADDSRRTADADSIEAEDAAAAAAQRERRNRRCACIIS